MKFYFNPKTGRLEMFGNSIHEPDTTRIFQPIFEALEAFLKVPTRKVHFHIGINSFNTGASRRIIEVLTMLEDYHLDDELGGDAFVSWYYEEGNLDMLEAGEEYAEDVTVPFELIEVRSGSLDF